MSYRRSNNLSTFFPDRYSKGEESDYRDSRQSYTSHRKDTYVPSHKDIFIPNGNSPKPERSGRSYPPVRPAFRDERQSHSSAYTRSDKYVPPSSQSPASTLKTPPVSNASNNSQYSTPATSIHEKSEYSATAWKTFAETKYKDQTHMLTATGEYQIFEKTISQLNKPAYRVTYDPELSKDHDKGKHAISQKLDHKHYKARDPRRENSSKPNSNTQPGKRFKKIPFKSLPLPKILYDKNSIGAPPPNEIVISGLARAFNEVYLRNEVKTHGEILEFESLMDPTTGIPLGILRVRFGGSYDKAYKSVKNSVSHLNETTIEGNKIQAGINKGGKLLEILRHKAIQERELKSKKNELVEKKISLPSAPKAVLNAISKRESLVTREKPPQQTVVNSQPKADSKVTASDKSSIRVGNDEFVVPPELDKYVKGRPFIYIASKYVKGQVEKNDIKKALETYDWTRVLYDPSGVYVVFNSARESQRCFQFENGKKVLSVNLYMEVHLPESYKLEASDEKYAHTQRDVIEESTSLLAKELESAVQKDIRTKIIAPAVIELLNIDNYPELKSKLAPPVKKPAVESNGKVGLPTVQAGNSSIDAFTLQRKAPKASSPKSKEFQNHTLGKKRGFSSKSKRALPMSYRLNFEDETESDFRESTVSTPQLDAYYKDEEEEERKENAGPAKKRMKLSSKKDHLPLLYSSSSEEEEDKDDDYENKRPKESQPTTPETPHGDKMEIDTQEKADVEQDAQTAEDTEDVVDESNVDYASFEKQYRPTPSNIPVTVYEENDGEIMNINGIQDLIKDEEDLSLLREVFSNSPSIVKAQYPEYVFWKLKSSSVPREVEKSAKAKGPKFLTNSTGSHRSEGYSKISDELKVEYLPHKRRVHDPLNTIQVENEENDSSKAQSSRVNRANNRRFAYEVSTFNNQNEILTLNQLNKRKKPVSFARSAIHNWGLYALEPIAQKEMIIEYVGERIRQQVADFREKAYLKSGIGSSYLFRIDENTVIDATKKGGIARFINHCCQPSCTAKIIKVEGQKRIVIYALRDIAANEELTYDYKFERETNDNERVRCLCGAPGCKGYLN